MARYYTVCAFTDSLEVGYSKRMYRYRHAPPAFLFHDDENPLHVREILKPLFRLSKLYEPDKQVIVVQVNGQTLAATFSLRGLPVPVRHNSWKGRGLVYPSGDELYGWAIRNVTSLAADPIPLDFGKIYDECLHLPRHADQCPCPLLDTGQCYEDNLKEVLPEEFTESALLRNHSELDRKVFKTKDFSAIYGFEYISPGMATNSDFTEAVRPWDQVDFSVVEDRREQFSERGKRR